VALRTDDRDLLQQMVAYAHDANSTESSMVRRTAAYVLALVAWHRNDLHDAMRWFGGDLTLFGTPPTEVPLKWWTSEIAGPGSPGRMLLCHEVGVRFPLSTGSRPRIG